MYAKRQDFEAWKALLGAQELPQPDNHKRQVQVRLPENGTIFVLDYTPFLLGQTKDWNYIRFTITTGVHFPVEGLDLWLPNEGSRSNSS